MNDATLSILLTCGVCCVYPLIAAVTAVIVDRRVRAHGWRSLIPQGKVKNES
jgi:hypothetical protein